MVCAAFYTSARPQICRVISKFGAKSYNLKFGAVFFLLWCEIEGIKPRPAPGGVQGEVPDLAGPPAPATQGEGREEEEAHPDYQPAKGQSIYTDEKEKKLFLISKEIQKGSVAKSSMTNGLPTYG